MKIKIEVIKREIHKRIRYNDISFFIKKMAKALRVN